MSEFYKTIFTIEVLSEGRMGDFLTPAQIDHAITDGNCVGTVVSVKEVELTPKEMADELYEFGSEPGFFQLDNDGNEVVEE